MLKIKDTTKTYVYCPANHTTGGAELLHQLVDKLNNYSIETYIVYSMEGAKVPYEYSSYNIKVANKIEDKEENIIVIYEGIFDKAFNIKRAQILLWWLSVDNFYYSSSNFLSIYDYLNWKPIFGLKLLIRRIGALLIKRRNIFKKKSIQDIKNLDALNCYQSEYAQNFLINKGFMRLAPLSDYINSDFIEQNQNLQDKKENIVLYNPKKGLRYTQKIIKANPNIDWIPLTGMDRNELLDAYKKSKLYIDFGYHPGKDRIPREAAINECCIITGMKGSARFFEDVTIPNYYKINENKITISTISERINDILQNYETHISNFESYRNKIKREPAEFDYQTRNIFNI